MAPATGALLLGLTTTGATATATSTVVEPPWPSLTVTVKVSDLSAEVAAALAAF